MKAVVLETRGRQAAILLKDGTVRIARGRYTVGEVIDCDVAPRPTWRQWTAAAAAMVALLGVSAGLWVDRNYIAYAEISLDVNPSIVYTLNKRDRVLSVRAANGDGAQIVEALKQGGVRFKPIEDAVDETMAMLEDAGYLDAGQEDYVLLNVSSDDEARREDLAGQVESAMGRTKQRDSTMEYRIDRSDRKTAREAAENGMSAGRYAAWQEKAEEDSKEAFREKPVREIMRGEQKMEASEPKASQPVPDDPPDEPHDDATAQSGKDQPQGGDKPSQQDGEMPGDNAAQQKPVEDMPVAGDEKRENAAPPEDGEASAPQMPSEEDGHDNDVPEKELPNVPSGDDRSGQATQGKVPGADAPNDDRKPAGSSDGTRNQPSRPDESSGKGNPTAGGGDQGGNRGSGNDRQGGPPGGGKPSGGGSSDGGKPSGGGGPTGGGPSH